MFRSGRNEMSDEQICAGQISEVALEVRELEAEAAKDPKKMAALQQARVRMEGARAECVLEQRMKRKEMVSGSRATRWGSKAEINAKKQEILQGRYATKMQRLEYRRAKAEAGMNGPGTKTRAVGFLALVAGAAAFFLL